LRRQPVIPAPFVAELPVGELTALFHKPCIKQTLDCAVQRVGPHLKSIPCFGLDLLDDGVTVFLPFRQRTEDVKNGGVAAPYIRCGYINERRALLSIDFPWELVHINCRCRALRAKEYGFLE
jgi:hypothetical protein